MSEELLVHIGRIVVKSLDHLHPKHWENGPMPRPMKVLFEKLGPLAKIEILTSNDEAKLHLVPLIMMLSELGLEIPNRREQVIKEAKKLGPKLLSSGRAPHYCDNIKKAVETPEEFTTLELTSTMSYLFKYDVMPTEETIEKINFLTDLMVDFAGTSPELVKIVQRLVQDDEMSAGTWLLTVVDGCYELLKDRGKPVN